MPKVPFKGFIGQTYKDSALQVATSETINWYLEKLDPNDAKSPEIFRPTPGTTFFTELSATGAVRGLYYDSSGRLYIVQNYQLFEVYEDGTYIFRGALNTSVNPVKMADNGFQLMIIDGTYGYIFTYATNTFQQITNPNFPTCNALIYQDSYFIVNETGTNRFHISAPLDGLEWDLDYASAEGCADNITNIINNNREIWLFGPQSYEVWYNSGQPDFPYARVPGSFSNVGLLATNSLTELNDVIFFLGGNKDGFGIVYMSDGYNVRRISTIPMEREITQYPSNEDAIASTYLQDGHFFYNLSFQGGNTTWSFDTTTGAWHKRTSYSTITNTENRWKILYTIFAFNQILATNYEGGDILILDPSSYTEEGSPIIRTRICPHLISSMNRVIYNSFQIDAQVGVGLPNVDTSAVGANPQVYLSYSDDGGMTYGNQVGVSLGRTGEYKTQLKWNRLGSSRDRVFKLTVSDPINPILIAAYLDVTECLHG